MPTLMTTSGSTQAPAPLIAFKTAAFSLSHERLAAYSLDSDIDSGDAAARYLWNMALANALQSVLHVTEIAFRNALFIAGAEAAARAGALTFGTIPCWLDAVPTLLQTKEAEDVAVVVRDLSRKPKRCTPGHLVSRMSFGFWVRLCQRPYEHGNVFGPKLWPYAITRRFANAPKAMRNREAVFRRADRIRDTRNMVAHHQPLWDADPVGRSNEALELIAWMNPNLARAVAQAASVDSVYAAGPRAYRALGEHLIGPFA
jgi:hypothetical protein